MSPIRLGKETKAYSLTLQGDTTRIDFHENPTVDLLKHIIEEIHKLRPTPKRLWVLEEADLLLTTKEVRELAEHSRTLDERPARVAVVAKRDVSYGTSRIHRVYRQSADTTVNVFRTLEEAEAWLQQEDSP